MLELLLVCFCLYLVRLVIGGWIIMGGGVGFCYCRCRGLRVFLIWIGILEIMLVCFCWGLALWDWLICWNFMVAILCYFHLRPEAIIYTDCQYFQVTFQVDCYSDGGISAWSNFPNFQAIPQDYYYKAIEWTDHADYLYFPAMF